MLDFFYGATLISLFVSCVNCGSEGGSINFNKHTFHGAHTLTFSLQQVHQTALGALTMSFPTHLDQNLFHN